MGSHERLVGLIDHILASKSDETPLLKIFRSFGVGGKTVGAIKRQYRISAIRIHPDKVPAALLDQANEASNYLNRAWEQVQSLSTYETWKSTKCDLDEADVNMEFRMYDDDIFSLNPTQEEMEIYEHDRARQRAQENAEQQPIVISDDEDGHAENDEAPQHNREEPPTQSREEPSPHGPDEPLRQEPEDSSPQEPDDPPLQGQHDTPPQSRDEPSPQNRDEQPPQSRNSPPHSPAKSNGSSQISPDEDEQSGNDWGSGIPLGDEEDSSSTEESKNSEERNYPRHSENVESGTVGSDGLLAGNEVPDVERSRADCVDEGSGGSDVAQSEQERRDERNEPPKSSPLASSRRRMQQAAARRKSYEKAKNALHREKGEARNWVPKPVHEITPRVGIQLRARWQCEQLCRAYTALKAPHDGIKMTATFAVLRCSCRTEECTSIIQFFRQPKSGQWKLNKFTPHKDSCLGHNGSARKTNCAAAYTAEQVSRLLLQYISEDPNITGKRIKEIVKAKQLYTRQPPDHHYRAILKSLRNQMARMREVEMAAMSGYISLLRAEGHHVSMKVISGREMREVRVKAAEFIFRQCQKSGKVGKDERFDRNMVDVSDIVDGDTYYAGFTFIPSIASHMCKHARLTCSADASHCQGSGPQSYGTFFEVLNYDANNQLTPLVSSHSIGTESRETWDLVFSACLSIEEFDKAGRVTIVDQEKSIDLSYRSHMKEASLFLDKHHVKKNMLPKVGTEKAAAADLYERALRAPSREAVDALKELYGRKTKEYLSKFDDSELYRAYSALQDLVVTSQGAESSMSAALRTQIRSVEPQTMLQKLVLLQRSRFLVKKQEALSCNAPVPPNVEKHLAKLIEKSRMYQESISWVPGAHQMEATVLSRKDASQRRHVVLSTSDHTPPSCCSFSKLGDGFPCLHGVAVICEKYGSVNLHKFIAPRHISSSWKRQYENVNFTVPPQDKIDNVIQSAKRLVAMKQNLQIPKALPPPRGRPSKDAGIRRKSWFENGPSEKRRRVHLCSLCQSSSHRADQCDLRQLFDEPNKDTFM